MPSAMGYVSEEGDEYLDWLVENVPAIDDRSDAIRFCVEYTASNKHNRDVSE